MTTTIILALVIVLLAAIGWKMRPVPMDGADATRQVPTKIRPIEVARPKAPATATEEGVRQLIARGEKIAAIKLLRELRGLGLKEAHDAVEAMSKGGGRPGYAGNPPQSAAQAAADPEFWRLIRDGQHLAAVKFYKDATGCGLKEAKEAMDRAAAEFGPR